MGVCRCVSVFPGVYACNNQYPPSSGCSCVNVCEHVRILVCMCVCVGSCNE